jgi:hypothetical protein
MVWYGMVWYGIVYDMTLDDMILYDTGEPGVVAKVCDNDLLSSFLINFI